MQLLNFQRINSRIDKSTGRLESVAGQGRAFVNTAAVLTFVILLSLVGCGQQRMLPKLALSPASLGRQLAQAQRLTFSPLRTRRQADKKSEIAAIDALVEITPESIQLVGFMLNQQILKLHWDGVNLVSEQSERLPPTVSAAQVLRDVQLVYWPNAAIQSSLPSGWKISTVKQQRELQQNGQLRIRIRYQTDVQRNGTIEFENLAEGYRLHIQAVAESAGNENAMQP